MDVLSLDPRIAAVGRVVGIMVGLSGAGGGSLVTPLLVLVLGKKPALAVGTDLVYSVPKKILGAFVHHRQGTVDWRVVRTLVAGGVPAAILGLATLKVAQVYLGIDAVNTVLRHGLNVMLLFVSLSIVLRPLLARRIQQPEDDLQGYGELASHMWRLVIPGAVVGFLVSLTSIGSDSLTVPLLYFLVPQLGLRRLVGADVAFAAILVPVAATGHLQMGQVDLRLAGNLVLGRSLAWSSAVGSALSSLKHCSVQPWRGH